MSVFKLLNTQRVKLYIRIRAFKGTAFNHVRHPRWCIVRLYNTIIRAVPAVNVGGGQECETRCSHCWVLVHVKGTKCKHVKVIFNFKTLLRELYSTAQKTNKSNNYICYCYCLQEHCVLQHCAVFINIKQNTSHETNTAY